MKRFLSLILALFASSASAQLGTAPGVIVFDEASQLGRARSLAFVGSTVSCGISGGAATCTFTAPSFTLTHNSTATSGCTAGAIFRSTSNLADCGAGLTWNSTSLLAVATSATPTFRLTASGGGYIELGFNTLPYIGGNGTDLRVANGTSLLPWNDQNANLGSASARWATVYAGSLNTYNTSATNVLVNATRIGDSTLGSTTVPLTARLGTGSTANAFEMQNSAGTVLAKFDSGGMLTSGATTNQRVSIGMLSSGYSEGLWIGNGAETPSASNYAINRVNSSPGLYINDSSSTGVYFRIGNTDVGGFTTSQLYALGTFALGSASDVILSRTAAGSLQLGNTITSGSAINQTFRSHNATTGTDISGGNLTITAPGGTGSSTGGTIAFQTAPVLASGTTAQTPVDRLTIAKDGTVAIGASLNVGTAGGYYSRLYSGGSAISGITTTSTYNVIESGTSDILFANNGGTAYIGRVTNAGLWNLGSSAIPTSKFEVQGVTGTTVAATINNGTSTGCILKAQDNGSDVFEVCDGGDIQILRTVTAAGTTGARTINQPNGSVNFAAAASTLVVTNSLAGTSSLIMLTAQTADATCTAFSAVRASGSFTITANAACTAETAVAFLVTN